MKAKTKETPKTKTDNTSEKVTLKQIKDEEFGFGLIGLGF